MLQREPLAQGVLEAAGHEGMGVIVFSPLAQGVLTNRYLEGVPKDSRATHGAWFDKSMIGGAGLEKLKKLDAVATARGQSLAQLAITWNLSQQGVTSCLIGASKTGQIADCAAAAEASLLSAAERATIDGILGV